MQTCETCEYYEKNELGCCAFFNWVEDPLNYCNQFTRRSMLKTAVVLLIYFLTSKKRRAEEDNTMTEFTTRQKIIIAILAYLSLL